MSYNDFTGMLDDDNDDYSDDEPTEEDHEDEDEDDQEGDNDPVDHLYHSLQLVNVDAGPSDTSDLDLIRDDHFLVNEYKKALQLSPFKRRRQEEWKVNDICQVVSPTDSLWHKATIVDVNGPRCTVQFEEFPSVRRVVAMAEIQDSIQEEQAKKRKASAT